MEDTEFKVVKVVSLTDDIYVVEIWFSEKYDGEDISASGATGPCNVLVGPKGAHILGPMFPLMESVKFVEELAIKAKG